MYDPKRSLAILMSAAALLAAAAGPADAHVAGDPLRTVTCLDQDLNSVKAASLGRENSIEAL